MESLRWEQEIHSPPKLIIIEYLGRNDGQKDFLILGKAVTFDTGGISLKPSEKMDEMKFDKCGGCNVNRHNEGTGSPVFTT